MSEHVEEQRSVGRTDASKWGLKASTVDRNKMRVKKGHLRPSPNEEAQMIKEETEKRRRLRLKQVREQSKENAAKIRQSVKHEKHKQLMKLATEIKTQLEEEKAERVRHLEQQYDNSLRNIGLGHRDAKIQPDWSEEREIVRAAENHLADLRGVEAMARLREETSRKMAEAQRINIARKKALEAEKARAAEIAAMPPPPPDPINNIDLKRKPVKVMDMNAYATTHYHLMNEQIVDRAGTPEQSDAREAAELEQERIKERALELKRLRQDQLERARVRHNIALEKELLKHDYDNILHDLSDLQRADRERRLRIVHNIPKQVFEPPNVRLEDREEKQKQMEQEFEDMYMAQTDYLGNISMALDPHPYPETPSGTASLDVTTTPLQEPTLPSVPPVLRDMTNVPKPKLPGKKPEKVLRNLMDRIKSQREEWIHSHSVMEVGEDTEQGMGAFKVLGPGEEIPASVKDLSPPEKLARVTSPVEPTSHQPGPRPVPKPRQIPSQPPAPSQGSVQWAAAPPPIPLVPPVVSQGPAPVPQSLVPITQGPAYDGRPPEVQQNELEEIVKQQQIIMEQKRQLELKLQQLTYQQQLQMANQLIEQQQIPLSSAPQYQQPVTSFPQGSAVPTQQIVHSLSSSQTSNQPMNSIPPTHTTSSVPITTAYQGQVQGHFQGQGHVYQPVSAALTTAQLMTPAVPTTGLTNGFGLDTSGIMVTGLQGQHAVSMATPASLGAPVPVSTPNFVGALPADGHTEQMRRVREYQQYLLARHEQSKKVLAETKAEIKRRRDNLLQRYPKLDLSRLEDLGAKYLDNQPPEQIVTEQFTMAAPPVSQGLGIYSTAQGQGQAVPVTSLLASLASHPYYAQTLSQQPLPGPGAPVSQALVNGVIGAVQTSVPQPDINFDTNLGKNKYDNIRKSLPFDTDDSFQSPAVRMYEAYTSKQLDTTTGTETTEADTSTSTERGSPKLKQATPAKFKPLHEESEGDTSSMESEASVEADSLTTRQEALLRQLADIQRQKEEIMQRHAAGQERVQEKQDQLKMKLATVSRADQQAQLRDTFSKLMKEKMSSVPQPSISETTIYPTDTTTSEDDSPERRQNLSTILEVETPASSRPSAGAPDRLSLGSTDTEGSFLSRRSLEGQGRPQPIPERSSLEDVETQIHKQDTELTAAYSGSNIQDILERAKRFETEVLEKLRKQTNAVLFDQKFDDSLEFDVSHRKVREVSASGQSLSSGSLTPDDSLSTGPLNESDITKSYDGHLASGSLQVSKSRDPASANGSFQSSRSWADELSTYKMPPTQQSELSFKVMKPDLTPDSTEKTTKEESMFAGDVNRFKVYSAINRSDSSSEVSSEGTPHGVSSVGKENRIPGEDRTLDAQDMLDHLRKLQEELKSGEQTRKMWEKTLAERQAKSWQEQLESYQKYESAKDKPAHTENDLSQYSIRSDEDKSVAKERQPSPVTELPVLPGKSSVQHEMPVRKSPIGDLVRSRSPFISGSPMEAGESRQEITTTEYSFTIADGKQRSTSTPGDERSKSKAERSELPSEITVDETLGVERTIPGSSDPGEFHTPKPHTARTEARQEVERMVESRGTAGTMGSSLSAYTITSETDTDMKESSSSEAQFKTMLPDSKQITSDFSTGSLVTFSGSSIDESSQQFKRLTEPEPPPRVKTYAVTIDGDLVSENSDSDMSAKFNKKFKPHEDLSTYSVSSVDESTQGLHITEGSSSVSTKDSKNDQFTELTKSSFPNIDEISERSEESQPKSSSFTNVTSDPSLNSMTGVSSLSQYTFQTEDMTGVPDLTQYTYKSEDMTDGQDLSQYSLKSTDKSENKSSNAPKEEGSDYMQQKFASLDKLISESKNLIAKHQVLKDKNKQLEEGSKEPLAEDKKREVTPNVQELSAGKSNVKKFKEWYLSTSPGTNSDSSKLSSFITDKDVSISTNKMEESTDVNSLEYLVEHSTGITEEPVPELTTSELNITEAFNRTDMSDSSDSLKSFEKHEMSTVDSVSESMSTSRTDDSWRASGEQSQSDSVQELVENRRKHFLAEAERRANIAKERALGISSKEKKDGGDVIFRAVPVSVVAEPKLSMSTKVSTAQRGRSSDRTGRTDAKSEQSFKDKKKSFEAIESEMKTSATPLNRALQPRGSGRADAGSRLADAGTRPKDMGARPKDGGGNVKPAAAVDKKKMGALTGEIRSFGGSAGLAAKQAYAKKIPPPTKPKPVRSKSAESGAPPPLPATAPPQLTETSVALPTTTAPVTQATSSLSRTLSSWKKSRSISAPAPSLTETAPPPKNSVKVLPEEAPEPLTEEEREQRAAPDNVIYERHMRLERQLDTDEPAPTKKVSQEPQRSQSLDRRDSRKDSENES